MLTFLVAILVILFLGSAILDAIANALSWTAFSGISLFKLVKKLKLKSHDKRMRKQEREVNVNCPCSNTFRATPKYDNDWVVTCPTCGRSLRVDISKKKNEEKWTITLDNDAAYKKYGLNYVQLSTANDSCTCEKCKKLEGKVYKLSKAPKLPLHEGCRCVYMYMTAKDAKKVKKKQKQGK